MIYVREVFFDGCDLVDSLSGEEYFSDKVDETILGYIVNGSVVPVSRGLVNFLSYVESVELKESSFDKIRVSWNRITVSDRYVVLFRLRDCFYVYTLLDVILSASFQNEMFMDMLKRGELVVAFGEAQYLSIRFCGDYMSAVVKAVTLYRSSIHFKERSSASGYLV